MGLGIKWLIPTAARIDTGTVTITVPSIEITEADRNEKIPYFAGSTDVSHVFPNRKFLIPTLAILGPPDRNIYTPIIITAMTVTMVKRNTIYRNTRSDNFFRAFMYLSFFS